MLIQSRECRKCKLNKDINCYEVTKKPSGLLGFRATCKECRKEYRAVSSKIYRTENKEQLKASQAIWRDNNREQYRQIHRNWRDKNRDVVSSIGKRFSAKHTAKLVAKARKREADQLNATPSWANQAEINKIYAEAVRLRKSGINVHVDHIVPLKGINVRGFHVHNNLRIISAAENLSKRNKLDESSYA